MDKYRLQWAGAPCGQHGSYTFYKAVKFFKNGRWRIVSLGEFFFLKFSETDPLCIGELQLLWEDRAADGQMLSSSRFYFLPESTPDGRKEKHGEDEVIAIDIKAIFKLEDLLEWICTDVAWNRGSLAVCSKDVKGPQCINNNGQLDDFALNNSKLNYADVKQEKKLIGDDETKDRVKILSFPEYCRYKTVLKRLENFDDAWLNDALVRALGGFTVPHRNTRLMYCKEEFEHPTLAYHEKLCDHLAPNLKGRPRKKKIIPKEKTVHLLQKASDDSIPESKPEKPAVKQPKLKRVKHGRKHRHKRPEDKRSEVMSSEVKTSSHVNNQLLESKTKLSLKTEETGEKMEVKKGRKSMESHLLSFMKSRNTPINRLPNLGFKKINLGLFWKIGQKLGGYEVICKKRLWKKIYDRLGGSPDSTSAATCTRRHYERLILPYERHLKGLGHLPLPRPYQRPKMEEDKKKPTEEVKKEAETKVVQVPMAQAKKEEVKKEEGEVEGDDAVAKSRKALKMKKRRKPKEKVKKLKDQLKELREKKAQMSLQPIATKDGLLIGGIKGINLPLPGATISNTKPDLSGVMADQAVLIPNVPGQVPTTLGGIRPITVKTEGGQGPIAPVILTIPSLHHPPMTSLPGVIATNPMKTESGVMSSERTQPMFAPHMNGSGGVITRAPIPAMPISSVAASHGSPAAQSQVIRKASQPQPNVIWSHMVPPVSSMSMPNNTVNAVSSAQHSLVKGSVTTSRPSVIQHTQQARTQPYMQTNAVHPSDLILRKMSPRKMHVSNRHPVEKTDKPSSQNGKEPIIVTPVNPYLTRFPGMPRMIIPGQLPFPAGVHPALRDQPPQPPPPPQPSSPMNTKRRRTESGKENLDGKSTNQANVPPQMPFFPVSVPMPRLVHPFQSLPEQDEPCDLSMPKKRKHEEQNTERNLIRERKHSNTPPHVRTLHMTKPGRSIVDFPSELPNHKTQAVEESSRHHNVNSRVPSLADYHKLHNSTHVKMTPTPRGSITKGVINPPPNSIAEVRKDLLNSHIKSEVPSHVPHTSSIPSFSSDAQSKGQIILPEFPNPHLLAAASGFPPRFLPRFVPPHLLTPPQLLANLPPNLAAANHEELLRRGFLVPPLGFSPPTLVGGALSQPQVKKEGQSAFVFQS